LRALDEKPQKRDNFKLKEIRFRILSRRINMRSANGRLLVLVLLSFLICGYVSADTLTWTNGAGGNWFTAGNWTNSAGANALPAAGDSVIIRSNVTVLLTNDTGALDTFTMGRGTLFFSNWMTRLQATTVLFTNGTWTHALTTTNGPGATTTTAAMTNRIWVACTDILIGSNALIDVQSKGYDSMIGPGAGAGGGSYGAGASHGGSGTFSGGATLPGVKYDLLEAPLLPGSGGGSSANITTWGGKGGGAVRIDASGTVTIFGRILANAGNGGTTHAGGGSGGSIYIACNILAGSTNGLLQANGGAQGGSGGGVGGGGRIALAYNPDSQASNPGVRMQAAGIWGGYGSLASDNGTVWLPNSLFLTPVIRDWLFQNVFLTVSNMTSWAVDSLIVSNANFVIANSNAQFTVTNDMILYKGGIGISGGSTLSCGGNVTLTVDFRTFRSRLI
jgi:hypothetical protein